MYTWVKEAAFTSLQSFTFGEKGQKIEPRVLHNWSIQVPTWPIFSFTINSHIFRAGSFTEKLKKNSGNSQTYSSHLLSTTVLQIDILYWCALSAKIYEQAIIENFELKFIFYMGIHSLFCCLLHRFWQIYITSVNRASLKIVSLIYCHPTSFFYITLP